eukprot:466992-Rhodomonas_salina.2
MNISSSEHSPAVFNLNNLYFHSSLKPENKERSRKNDDLDLLELGNQMQEQTLESPRVMTTARQSEGEGLDEGKSLSHYGGFADLCTARRAHNRAVGLSDLSL